MPVYTATASSFTPRKTERVMLKIVMMAPTSSTASTAATAIRALRRCLAAARRTCPSSTRSTTTTVTLSEPPAASAASTRLSVQICAVEDWTAMRSISPSEIMDERPSEHRMSRSPSSMLSWKWSAYMSGSDPSARVMTERLGCTRASSAVISPASTSSST